MNRPALVTIAAAAALSLGGCGKQSCPDHAEGAYERHAGHEHQAEHAQNGEPATPHGEHAPAVMGPTARLVEFPASAGSEQPREVKVLVDEPALKLVTIVLRKGTLLPEHHSEVAVTIQALQGTGTVTTRAEHFRIDPTHAVVLAPKVPHAVQPDEGTDLVLLVHHLGRGGEEHHH